ncbi:MarR family winged helix-turn-helix transcriptional regulator, partial [Mycobacterium sp.]|uniref:MarR family winged helix-turn-helix transcriptional regulator n=1 Tax=Mycobacterium sp. TaxID=1785 RepID=UPI001284074A
REAGETFPSESLLTMMMLYRAVAATDRKHAAELSPYKLSLSQFQALSVLHRVRRSVTMGELAELLSIRPANLTGMVDTLAKRSLVRRVLNPRDRRSILVEITPAAEEFLGHFLPYHWDYLKTLTSGLTDDELRQLADLLDRLRASIEAAPACSPPPLPVLMPTGQVETAHRADASTTAQ